MYFTYIYQVCYIITQITDTKPKEKQPDSDNGGFVDDLELDEFGLYILYS